MNEPITTLVWKQRSPMGYTEAVRGFGTVAAPVLTGFSLAAVVTLLTSTQSPPYADWAVTSFSVAAVSLLLTIHFSLHAAQYGMPPGERLDWLPEARVDTVRLNHLRTIQARERRLEERFGNRARYAYTVGVTTFSAGLLVVLIPERWSFARIVAIVLVGTCSGFQLVSAFANPLGRWLYPDVTDEASMVALTPMTGAALDSVMIDESRRGSAEPPSARDPATGVWEPPSPPWPLTSLPTGPVPNRRTGRRRR